MTNVTVITPPAQEPVSLASAKAFLRLGHNGEDELVSDLIASARARIEQESGLALVTQELRLAWSAWPLSLSGRGVALSRRPVTALVSVLLVDPDGTLTDQTERFRLDCGRLMLRPWSWCPIIALGGSVQVTFEAGFGTADEVPEDLKEACLRLVGALYASRGSATASFTVGSALPDAVQSILNARREVRL